MTNIQPPMERFERPDPVLTNKIVTHLKSQGIFDQFRRECMADVDTKPAYHNLRQRVEGSVAAFLRLNPWRPDMNKNQLRDNLRKHIQSGGFLDIGVDRIVDQVVNPKIYTVFLPKVEEVVQNCLGTENDKPKFEPLPSTEVNSEPPKFQDKHNLAPRAKLPAPLTGPMLKPLKPLDQQEEKSASLDQKLTDNGADTDTDEAGDKKYIVDDDEDKEEDEDDEESPPFEPHSEGDRMILGMRSDTSENSSDSQVVTTIVDDSLEDRIDNDEAVIQEESDKKDEDSSSDEYVPKTPTINMEESDGTVVEFNSISEYKQYQNKFEESFGNIEEVVASHDDNCVPVREERSSNEEDSVSGPQKRSINDPITNDSYDDASNSVSDTESTSDEIKPALFETFMKKQFKIEEYDHDNDTSEFSANENEDSFTEKSLDIICTKTEELDSGHLENPKDRDLSSKDPGKTINIDHKDNRESSNYHSSNDKTPEKEYHEKSRSSHSSKDKKENHKKSENHERSKDHDKDRDRKRSESSSKHNEKSGQGKLHDKEKGREKDKNRSKSSERPKKDKEDHSKHRKDSKYEHKEHNQEIRSRSDPDKEKKKHISRDKRSEGKEDYDSVHKSEDKERKHDSKYHSSSKHSHRSSSEKHKSDKDHKHKGSSDRHKSHSKRSDKESKDESKKKYREHCKYNNDKDENRRSSDRDSSGPSDRAHISSSSKSRSSSSRADKDLKVEATEKTTSNSDNNVSDNMEAIHNAWNVMSDGTSKNGTLRVVTDTFKSDCNSSNEELAQPSGKEENLADYGLNRVGDKDTSDEMVEGNRDIASNFQADASISKNYITSSLQTETSITENDRDQEISIYSEDKTVEEKNPCSDTKPEPVSGSVSLNDSSSEKENIEQDITEQTSSEPDGNSTDASLDEDSTIKFKKPKIAKNIHEVKKIMEARRQLKRIEKKRLKELAKSDSEEYESDEKSGNGNKLDNEIFRGFEDDLSLDKIKKYDNMIERLESEASQLNKLTNYDRLNTNLVTSWINLNPDLDTYIENTLKGKVHRSYRVRLPPICNDNYNYDSDQNCYFLVKNWDNTDDKEILVDSNLNNLNSFGSTTQQEDKIFGNEKSRKRKLVDVSCTSMGVLQEDYEYPEINSVKQKVDHRTGQSDDEVIIIQEESISDSSNVGTKEMATKVIATQETFSLTYNQTYDEVLKEKAQNSVIPSKKDTKDTFKNSRTVVKITNNQSCEQVVVKKIQSDSEHKYQVPRITRSETVVNGDKIDPKKVPFICRITKARNNTTPSAMKINCQQTIMSSDSTTNSKFQENFPIGVSRKMIDDVIGIQYVSSDQDTVSDQSCNSGEEVSEQKRGRTSGCRQQRYDSSDLYKPRPQLGSRRGRPRLSSSPEETSVPQGMTRRKRSAASAPDPNLSASKRRR